MSIGIIGCGTLGRSLLIAFQKKHTRLRYLASVRTDDSMDLVRMIKHVRVVTDNRKIASSDQLFLCVKPLDAKQACSSIRGHIKDKTVIVSAVAAVPLKKLQEWLDHERVVKIMPTILPDGPITVYNPYQYNFLLPTNNLIKIKSEADLDITTAVSGCMPGLLSFILEQWIEAAVSIGTDPKIAEQLILHNLEAMGRLGLKNKKELIQLRHQVSSKGGATEQGVVSLERSGIHPTLTEMLWEADDRITELARQFRTEE